MSFTVFKIDVWWKSVLLLGLIACVGAVSLNIDFIESKHLFGLGTGMVVIGIAHWIAWKDVSILFSTGLLSTRKIKHNIYSSILLTLGIVITGIFCFLVIKGLI